MISKGGENEKQENSSLCQRAWVNTCPQMSPYSSEYRQLSQIPLMINNKIELLKCTLNCTKIDERMSKLKFPIFMENTLNFSPRCFYIQNMLGMSMKTRACVASRKVLGHMGWPISGQIPGTSRHALFMPWYLLTMQI